MKEEIVIKRHFVRFYSPGMFVAEMSEKPIDKWDVKQAMEMADEIQERHGATPYGFCFITMGNDFMDKIIAAKKKYIIAKMEYLKKIFISKKPDQSKKSKSLLRIGLAISA